MVAIMTTQNERDLKKELIKTLEQLSNDEPIYRDYLNQRIQQLKDEDVIIPKFDDENVHTFLTILDKYLQKLRMQFQAKAKRSHL